MEIGLQTFTVRKLMRTPEALNHTFAWLAEKNLRNLELAVDYLAFPFTLETAKMIRTAADQHGLHVRSCQIKHATSAKDIPATIAFMQQVGAQILVNSTIDLKLLHKGEAGLLHYCELLDQLGEQLAPAGITLAHHNHHYEFLRVGKQSALHFMAANSGVAFALDTYWCQKGGGNVPALLEELQGRVPILHLRDFTLTRIGLITGGRDCEIGRGNISFQAILRAAEHAGVHYGMIEQNTKTPLESVEISLQGVQV